MEHSDDEILSVFASNVLWFRTRIDISQEELAFRADQHRQYIGGIERAEVEPTIRIVSRLSRVFGMPPFELLVERPDAMKFWKETRSKDSKTSTRK
jgi:transcriptional regulator with XRE-family HTH domain